MNNKWKYCVQCKKEGNTTVAAYKLDYIFSAKVNTFQMCGTHAKFKLKTLREMYNIYAEVSTVPEPVELLWQ